MSGEPAGSSLAALNALLRHARSRSSFHRERLPDHSLRSLEELSDLPMLTAEQLRGGLPPEGTEALAGPLEATYAFSTGGTTGRPKLVFFTAAELDEEAAALAHGFAAGGIRRGMVAANLMNAGHLWASFVVVNRVLEHCGCHILPIAAQSGEVEALDLLRVLGAEVAVGIPSFMVSLAQRAEAEGLRDLRIPILATGGEHFLEPARDYVRPRLGVERFLSAGYSSSDTGIIGYQCEECRGGIHHVFDDLCLVEVVDEATGRPLPVGEAGRILVTKLRRRLTPVIRYDLGDCGRILPDPCPCGRGGTLLELLGRADDVLVIGGYNVTPEQVGEVLVADPRLSPHFRMLARLEGPLALLVIECEAAAPCPNLEAHAIGAEAEARLLASCPALAFLLESKGIAAPRCVVLAPGALPRHPRTGKLRRVVDERMGSAPAPGGPGGPHAGGAP